MTWDDILTEEEHLEHHGILGMKWGVRRFQNKDGSLTSAGKARYGSGKGLKERISDFNKKRVARIKESTMRSGDINKVLKNQKYLTDAEFEKAVKRAKTTESLKAKDEKPKSAAAEKLKEGIVDALTKERHLPETLTKERHLPQKDQRIKDAEIENKIARMAASNKAKISEREMLDEFKKQKLFGLKDKDQREFELRAQQVVQQNNKQKTSGITWDKVQKGAKTAAKIWATYTAVAKVVNAVSGDDNKMPTSASGITKKFLGSMGVDTSGKKKENALSTVVFEGNGGFDSSKWETMNKKDEEKKKKQKNKNEKVVIEPTWLDAPLNNLPKNDEKKVESIIDDYSDMALDIFEEMYGK